MKATREQIKALAKAKREQGVPYRKIALQLDTSPSQIQKLIKEDCSPVELETARKALLIQEHNIARQSGTINILINKNVLDRIMQEGTLNDIDLQTLSKMGHDTSRVRESAVKSVQNLDGTAPGGPPVPSVAALLAFALAKAEVDRQATARIKAETAAYEASYKEKVVN